MPSPQPPTPPPPTPPPPAGPSTPRPPGGPKHIDPVDPSSAEGQAAFEALNTALAEIQVSMWQRQAAAKAGAA